MRAIGNRRRRRVQAFGESSPAPVPKNLGEPSPIYFDWDSVAGRTDIAGPNSPPDPTIPNLKLDDFGLGDYLCPIVNGVFVSGDDHRWTGTQRAPTRNPNRPTKTAPKKSGIHGVGSWGDEGGYLDDGALPWYGDFTSNDFAAPDLSGPTFSGGDFSAPSLGDMGGNFSEGIGDFPWYGDPFAGGFDVPDLGGGGVGNDISGPEIGGVIDYGAPVFEDLPIFGGGTGLPDVGGVIDYGPGSYIDNPGGGGNLPGEINYGPFLPDVGGIEDVFGGGVLKDDSLGRGGIFSGVSNSTIGGIIGTGLKIGLGIDLTSILGGDGRSITIGGGSGSTSGNNAGQSSGNKSSSTSGGALALGLLAAAALLLTSKK